MGVTGSIPAGLSLAVSDDYYGLAPSAHGQAEYETNTEADSDSGKRVTLNCIAGFLDRVGRHVLSAFVLAARHVPYAVTQILDILSDLLNVRR